MDRPRDPSALQHLLEVRLPDSDRSANPDRAQIATRDPRPDSLRMDPQTLRHILTVKNSSSARTGASRPPVRPLFVCAVLDNGVPYCCHVKRAPGSNVSPPAPGGVTTDARLPAGFRPTLHDSTLDPPAAARYPFGQGRRDDRTRSWQRIPISLQEVRAYSTVRPRWSVTDLGIRSRASGLLRGLQAMKPRLAARGSPGWLILRDSSESRTSPGARRSRGRRSRTQARPRAAMRLTPSSTTMAMLSCT
jgi:hypothetical protein